MRGEPYVGRCASPLLSRWPETFHGRTETDRRCRRPATQRVMTPAGVARLCYQHAAIWREREQERRNRARSP